MNFWKIKKKSYQKFRFFNEKIENFENLEGGANIAFPPYRDAFQTPRIVVLSSRVLINLVW